MIPGPYRVDGRTVKAGDRVLAFVVETPSYESYNQWQERLGTSELFAAAPDLLAACEYLTTLIVEGGNGEGWTLNEAYDRASEAIKKARGES